ncbi:MAG: branched-chain amino acid ABC transporter permease [Alphaproteobacteria bacterium]
MSLIIYGTLVGLVYGLWAVSFAIIFRSVRIFHVLHAASFTVAAYGCWIVAKATGGIWYGIAFGLITAVLVGLASEILLYRPLMRMRVRPGLLFVVSLGAYIVVENLIQLVWRADSRTIDLPPSLTTSFKLGATGVSAIELIESLAMLMLWLLTLFLLRFTMLGKAIRAISIAPEMAELAGVDVKLIRRLAFAFGSLLIGISGILFLMRVGIEPTSGIPVWIIAVVASLIGRSHPVWSYVAGLGIGLCEAIILLWLPAAWQSAIPVLVLMAYLIFVAVSRGIEAVMARSRAQRQLQDA